MSDSRQQTAIREGDLPRPPVAEAAPWAFPEPQQYRLSNGIGVLIYPLPGQHVASVRICFPALLAAEPYEREGIATIVARTMDEGTRSHTAEELAELFERNGIALGAGAGERGLTVDLEATTGRLGMALELVTECLSEPTFEEHEVGRHVRQRLSEIEHELASPTARAAIEWARTFYTADSRAARPTRGGRETVAAIAPQDCRDYHAQHVRPEGATVVVAGDVDATGVLADLERTLGSWTPERVYPPTAFDADSYADRWSDEGTRITFVDRPGSVQTEIHLGAPGPSRRATTGWAPYPVLAFIMGGSPSARIDAVLREDKGFTYGMRAGFRARRRDGVFTVHGSVRGDVTVEALQLLVQILDRAADGFTEDEVRGAVDYIGKTAPGRYATADVVADEAAVLDLDGETTQFVTRYLQQLHDLTPEQVAEAWRLWGTGPRTLVLVGDAAAHADAVRSLDLGPVTVIS